MKTDPNAPAYPHETGPDISPGITKREFLAGLIMQGINEGLLRNLNGIQPEDSPTLQQAADAAVRQADALIDALNEE